MPYERDVPRLHRVDNLAQFGLRLLALSSYGAVAIPAHARCRIAPHFPLQPPRRQAAFALRAPGDRSTHVYLLESLKCFCLHFGEQNRWRSCRASCTSNGLPQISQSRHSEPRISRNVASSMNPSNERGITATVLPSKRNQKSLVLALNASTDFRLRASASRIICCAA